MTAIVALGVVIRGETYHFEIVAGESARGIMALTLDGLAIGNGILTVENEAQALARARPDRKGQGRRGGQGGAGDAGAEGALRLTVDVKPPAPRCADSRYSPPRPGCTRSPGRRRRPARPRDPLHQVGVGDEGPAEGDRVGSRRRVPPAPCSNAIVRVEDQRSREALADGGRDRRPIRLAERAFGRRLAQLEEGDADLAPAARRGGGEQGAGSLSLHALDLAVGRKPDGGAVRPDRAATASVDLAQQADAILDRSRHIRRRESWCRRAGIGRSDSRWRHGSARRRSRPPGRCARRAA